METQYSDSQGGGGSLTVVSCEFHYDSAHRLPLVPDGHKCGRLHGHTYRLIVEVAGNVREDGFVVDFAEIKSALAPLVRQLDHHYLNEIDGLDNPTVENQLTWLWDRITLRGLSRLTIYEGLQNHASYP